MAGDEIRLKQLSRLAASALKTKALISQGQFVLLEGVPRLVSLKAVTTQGGAVTAASGSIPPSSAKPKVSYLGCGVKCFAYPGRQIGRTRSLSRSLICGLLVWLYTGLQYNRLRFTLRKLRSTYLCFSHS